MNVVNISEPVTVLLLTLATVLLIFLGRELKKPIFPALALIGYLVLVVFHSVQLAVLPEIYYEQYHDLLIRCVSMDCILIFISFFAYLWIDDIASKFFKKKSLDNSLDWFWRNV